MSILQFIDTELAIKRAASCDKLLFSPVSGFWSSRYGWVPDDKLADRYAPAAFVEGLSRVKPAPGMSMVPVDAIELCDQPEFYEAVWQVASARRHFEPDVSPDVLTYLTGDELCQLFNGLQSKQVAYTLKKNSFVLIDSNHLRCQRR